MSDIVCCVCNEQCTKDYVQALEKVWHTHHFKCKECDNSLAGEAFFEHEGNPFCKDCFGKIVAPKCTCCDEPIIGDVTTALGKTWKPEHFVCCQCKKGFEAGEGFLEKEGKPYCKQDYYELFKVKCSKCSKPVIDKTVTAMDKKWHPECFVCAHSKCGNPFPSGRFYVVQDLPYCLDHSSGEDKNANIEYEAPYDLFPKQPADLREKNRNIYAST